MSHIRPQASCPRYFFKSFSAFGSIRFKQLSACMPGIPPFITCVSFLQEIMGNWSSRSTGHGKQALQISGITTSQLHPLL
ncbi:MAG: hypothetical protein L0Z73_05905 [Gammaproteobacteria bacterium]|nr:hypothetical protein [Gammaproteobacteria bacterium]